MASGKARKGNKQHLLARSRTAWLEKHPGKTTRRIIPIVRQVN